MIRVTGLLSVLFLLGSCSGMPVKPIYPSGFLSNYTGFKENPKVNNAYYRKSDSFSIENFNDYTQLALAPVEVILAPGETLQISDRQSQKALTDYFSQQIEQKIAGRYQLVPVGTPNSLLIRIALTDIREQEIGMQLRDLIPTPVSVARTVAEKAYELSLAKKAVIAAASLEAEAVDTNTGESLVAVIVQRDSGQVYVDDKENNIDAVKQVIDVWVDRLTVALRTGVYQVDNEDDGLGLNIL